MGEGRHWLSFGLLKCAHVPASFWKSLTFLITWQWLGNFWREGGLKGNGGGEGSAVSLEGRTQRKDGVEASPPAQGGSSLRTLQAPVQQMVSVCLVFLHCVGEGDGKKF